MINIIRKTYFIPTLIVAGMLSFQAHSFPRYSGESIVPASTTFIQASTSQEKGAYIFVESMTNNGLAFISNKDLTKAQKSKKFKHLLNKSFDINAIGKFAVGRYWRQMNAKQQSEYLKLFREMLISVYSKRFDEYQGQDVKLFDTVPLSEKDTLVKSKIIDPDGGPDVPVDWRVRYKNGAYKIIDVLVAGVSMSVTQRSDFSSVIQRGGGDVSILIDHLKH